MTPIPRRALFLVFLICAFQTCFSADDGPFSLTAKKVTKNTGPRDIGYIDDGYAWGFGDLGFMLNGHGLPGRRQTFVITHESDHGKTELIWPVFDYGGNQANAEVLDHTLVFTASLPDGSPVLMAHRLGEPPIVISPAVLRLAAHRLGTSVVVPGTDYVFTKVRLPPDRIWLKAQPISSVSYPPQGVFAVELTSDDLGKVIDEARHRGHPYKANKFDYIAEEGSPTRINPADAREMGVIVATTNLVALTPTIHKTAPYIPRRDEMLNGNAVLDPVNHYAYFSTVHEPGEMLQVAPGNGTNAPPAIVGAVILEGEEDEFDFSAIDPQGGYVYLGTSYPGHLVKVALGVSNAPPYRVGSVLIDENNNVGRMVLDAVNGYGYVCVAKSLYKLRLGKGDQTPSTICHIDLPDGVGGGWIDPAMHCAYFSAERAMIKVALGEGDAPPKFIGQVIFPDDDWGFVGGILDPESGYAWFTSGNAQIIKIALGGKDGLPRRIGELKVPSPYQYLQSTFGRDDSGYAYLGTTGGGLAGDPQCCQGGVLKIALGKGDDLPRVASFMPLPDGVDIEEGVVDSETQTMYVGVRVAGVGSKILKLSLGQGDAPPKLLSWARLYPK